MAGDLGKQRPGPASRGSALALATVMGVAGITHFVAPGPFERIVPRILGHQHLLVRVSGIGELIACGLLARPRTRRFGGWWTIALLVAVFPANLQMALDSGTGAGNFPFNASALVWLRLPLQAPLIWWAYRQTA